MSATVIEQDEDQALELQLVLDRVSALGGADRIGAIEDIMEDHPEHSVDMPLRHVFTPGLYTREIFIPKGTIATTRTHLVEHPFVLLKGTAYVWTEKDGWQMFVAPYMGITKPGTRRVLYAKEDVVWTTFHATDKTTPDEVVREATYSEGKYENLGAAASKPTDLIYQHKELTS